MDGTGRRELGDQSGTTESLATALVDAVAELVDDHAPATLNRDGNVLVGVSVSSYASSTLSHLGKAGIAKLVRLLKSDDPSTRSSAASELTQSRAVASLSSIQHALADSEPGVRTFGLQAAGILRNTQLLPAVVKGLSDCDEGARQAATRALACIGGSSALSALIARLSSSRALEDRHSLVTAIGVFGNPAALDAVLEVSAAGYEARDWGLDLVVTEALFRMGPPARAGLLDALDSESWSKRAAAASALGQTRDTSLVEKLLEMLSDADRRVREEVVRALGRIGSAAAIPAIADSLNDPDPSVAFQAADALAEIGDYAAVQPLADAYRRPGRRDDCARALATIGGPGVAQILNERLEDYDKWGDDNSVTVALVNLGGTQAVEVLQRGLVSATTRVREQSALALGALQAETAVPALMVLLGDEDAGVRDCAALALGDIASRAATPALLAVVQDRHEEPEVRVNAADALRYIGDSCAVPVLLRVIDQSDEPIAVRIGAAKALLKVAEPGVVPHVAAAAVSLMLDRSNQYPWNDPSVRLEGLIELGPAALPEVNRALLARDGGTRAVALRALAHMVGQAGTERVVLALSDRSQVVREAALELLGDIGDATTLPYLLEMLGDCSPTMRAWALISLGSTGKRLALTPLSRALLIHDQTLHHARVYIDGVLALDVSKSDSDWKPQVADVLRTAGEAAEAAGSVVEGTEQCTDWPTWPPSMDALEDIIADYSLAVVELDDGCALWDDWFPPC